MIRVLFIATLLTILPNNVLAETDELQTEIMETSTFMEVQAALQAYDEEIGVGKGLVREGDFTLSQKDSSNNQLEKAIMQSVVDNTAAHLKKKSYRGPASIPFEVKN